MERGLEFYGNLGEFSVGCDWFFLLQLFLGYFILCADCGVYAIHKIIGSVQSKAHTTIF